MTEEGQLTINKDKAKLGDSEYYISAAPKGANSAKYPKKTIKITLEWGCSYKASQIATDTNLVFKYTEG